jgi:hypothetical protein
MVIKPNGTAVAPFLQASVSTHIRNANCLQEPTPPGKVEVLTYAPGFEKARTDADLAQLYRDNLDPDLAPFKRSGGIGIQEFKDFVTVSAAQ